MATLSTVVILITAGLYVTAFGMVPPGEQLRVALGGSDGEPRQPAEAPPSAGPLVQGEIGQVDPRPTATSSPLGPVVNGRVQPAPVDPPPSAGGSYSVVPGHAMPAAGSSGEVVRYVVEVERGLPFDPQDFAATVHAILNDDRGWGHGGKLRFERVDEGSVRIRVSLSSASLTDEQCAPLQTLGKVSCWNGSRAVINAERWGMGAETYGADLLSYREYVISHEIGHGLGHGHVSCPGAGKAAPVMVQQTKSLEGCVANPWPYP